MKILIFEYIVGGGFNKQSLPESLITEGSLMLRALLDNLTKLDNIEITVMLDWRLGDLLSETLVNTVIIGPEHNCTEEFTRLAGQSDMVWPIAPEFDGVLQRLCQTTSALGKILLTSPEAAVAIAGDKYKTYQLLNKHHIATVPTQLLNPLDNHFLTKTQAHDEWIIKPIDGVGCADTYVITNKHDLEQIAPDQHTYILQPHLKGDKTSLSCLFKQGQAWLVCVNLQKFTLINRQYHLSDIVINHHADPGHYQHLIDRIALALPELWGYVGIDLIETAEKTLVLEINPRLTTSFVGIYQALGINIAEAVLQLLQGEPTLIKNTNNPILIHTDAR